MLREYYKKNKDVYYAWIVANVLDLFTTIYGTLYLGFLEFNPVARAVISLSLILFIIVKVLVTAFALILPRKLLTVLTILLLLIVLLNSYLIFSII